MGIHKKKYRILSLDGGGSWAIIQVKCLRKLFADVFGKDDPHGHEVLAYFDLVVANSGGSLVAAALAENYKLSQIEKIFNSEDMRRSVFSKLGFWERSLLNSVARLAGIGPKYATARKYTALEKMLPVVSRLSLSQLPGHISKEHATHFLIIGYDYYRNRAELFRSDLGSQTLVSVIEKRVFPQLESHSKPDDVTMLQAIHASSTAPVNFYNKPAALIINAKSRYFWDGGVTGNNNPLLIGITEAWSNGYTTENIQVLSIGTGGKLLPVATDLPALYTELLAETKKSTLLRDIEKMATSILNDPPDFATFVAYTMLYPGLPVKNQNFIRLNPMLQPILVQTAGKSMWNLPPGLTLKEFNQLKHMEMDSIKNDEVELIGHFCNQWLAGSVPNQSIRNNNWLEGILGHNSYQEGIEDFKRWG